MAFIFYVTQVQFDFGASKLLADECKRVGIARPLVVTDKGVVAAGVAEQALRAIHGALPYAVFDETPGNPTEAAVLKALDAYRAHGADGLIAVGGGSSIDLAKGVGHSRGTSRAAHAIRHDRGRQREDQRAHCAPLIAMPTTAGTGSEVARGAIIILERRPQSSASIRGTGPQGRPSAIPSSRWACRRT